MFLYFLIYLWKNYNSLIIIAKLPLNIVIRFNKYFLQNSFSSETQKYFKVVIQLIKISWMMSILTWSTLCLLLKCKKDKSSQKIIHFYWPRARSDISVLKCIFSLSWIHFLTYHLPLTLQRSWVTLLKDHKKVVEAPISIKYCFIISSKAEKVLIIFDSILCFS